MYARKGEEESIGRPKNRDNWWTRVVDDKLSRGSFVHSI